MFNGDRLETLTIIPSFYSESNANGARTIQHNKIKLLYTVEFL